MFWKASHLPGPNVLLFHCVNVDLGKFLTVYIYHNDPGAVLPSAVAPYKTAQFTCDSVKTVELDRSGYATFWQQFPGYQGPFWVGVITETSPGVFLTALTSGTFPAEWDIWRTVNFDPITYIFY